MASRAAFRAPAQGFWRPVARARAAATAAVHDDGPAKAKQRGSYAPVCVALGMIALSVTLGLSTARQQLAHAPNVRVDKKKRETVPEVAAPDLALDESQRYVAGSVFRRVASLQDDFDGGVAASDHTAKKAVTLKDVGVDPPGIEQSRKGIREQAFKKNLA